NPGPSDEFVPRPYGRLRRRCHRSLLLQSPHTSRLDQARALHFSFAGDRFLSRHGRYRHHQLDGPSPAPSQSRSLVPPAATDFRCRLQSRPRHQRRPEGHGHHHHRPRRRRPDEDLRRPLLGHPLLPPRHGRRHDGGRLAHHQDHGPAHHKAHPVRRLFRRSRRRPHANGHSAFRHPRKHHTHYHRRHRRRRRFPPPLRRPLGRDAAHRLRLGPHHSRRGPLRRGSLPSRTPVA